MAKKPVASSETVDQGEIPSSKFGSPQEKGVQNGLGLEHFLPSPGKAKAADADPDPDEAEADEQDTEPKKETPPKDPVTGRFLKVKKESEPPVEDAKPDDDAETLKKRLKDTRDWATKINKTNQDLVSRLKKLEADHAALSKELHGTPKEDAVDPAELAKLNERARISRAVAEQAYGKEMVEELIYAEGSPYRQLEQADPYVKARVFQADQPVMEAIKQLKIKNFHDVYGDDPDQIVAKITEEVKADFVRNLKERGRGKQTVEDVGGLHSVGSHDASSHVVPDASDKPKTVDLRTVFPGFPTGSF